MARKKFKVIGFGDYEFLTISYGLSGPSGTYPCLYCLAKKSDFQNPTPESAFEKRTLEQLQANYSAFVASGSETNKAKQFNNCIRPCLLPIEPESVCVCLCCTLTSGYSRGCSRP